MLLGRHGECRQLESLLDDARRGTSRTVIVRGDAGMGKSALLAFVASRADGFDVHTATGVESETDLPYGALLAILRPLLDFLDRLPGVQRSALGAALAISQGQVADRFTAYAGALTLVASAAEIRPQLILVDDLQWLDRPSAEALLFVARRLANDRVAIVVTVRDGEDTIDLRGLSLLHIAGLDTDSSRKLIRRRYPPEEVPDDVAERVARLTGGAPLALVEIPNQLSSAQLRGAEPLPDPLPVGDAIRRSFRREIVSLPEDTIWALLVLAAEDRGSLALVSRALASRSATTDVLAPAEQAHLITIEDGRARFRHPVLRAAVYHNASPSERRAAHRALAEACGPQDLDRRTWHAAAAALEPDENVAKALEASADASRTRGAFASAARALERAAHLTSDTDVRARRLLSAAENAWRAGDIVRTQRLLSTSLDLTRDPVLLADVLVLRGRFLYTHGSATDAYDMLLEAADAVEAVAPDKAAALLMQAAWTCFGAAELQRAHNAAERASEIARRVGGTVELASMVTLSEALMLLGRSRETRPLLEAWKVAVKEHEDQIRSLWPNPNVIVVYLIAEDYAFADLLLHRFHASAAATPEVLPMVLACVSQFEFRTGDWAAAYGHATQGAQLGIAIGQKASAGFVLANLAIVEAGLGRAEAKEHGQQVLGLVAETGFRSLRTYVGNAFGLLDLGAGRIDSAIRELEAVEAMMREWGVRDPSIVQWMPDLIEAYVRAARRHEAEALLESLSTQAEDTDGNWARATAARCTGMLADSFDDHFVRALGLHAAMPTPFDRARTQLCYGERLRRAGRRVEARAQLHAALETFERLGASDWRKRAAAELGVSAERLASHDSAIDHLSPQELQVSLLVAEGATNRETAAALFVTTKTVEFHLRNAYRKLEVRSRVELARVVTARRGVSDPAGHPSAPDPRSSAAPIPPEN